MALIPLEQLPVTLLPAQLWGSRAEQSRSAELSLLYVERYQGRLDSLSLGSHEFWEFLCVMDGRGFLRSNSGRRAFESGSAFLIPPHVDHAEEARGKVDVLWVGLSGTRLAELREDRIVSACANELRPPSERLWTRSQFGSGRIGPELEGLTLALLNQFFCMAEQKPPEHAHVVDRIVEHMNTHYAGDCSIATLAARFNLSQGYLYRSFKMRTGMTPVVYLTRMRMKRAAKWLQYTNDPIRQIALRLGYSDPLYFSRAFKRVTGRSPSEVRETRSY